MARATETQCAAKRERRGFLSGAVMALGASLSFVAARALILTALGGAPFALLQTGGYAFAPLVHGAAIAPSTVTILSAIGAALFLGERLSRNHLAPRRMTGHGSPRSRVCRLVALALVREGGPRARRRFSRRRARSSRV